jgi:uncharacterized protein YndB with AHSA1/START domain
VVPGTKRGAWHRAGCLAPWWRAETCPPALLPTVTVHVEVESEAAPERVWNLYAQPERWKEWAPHIRGPHNLGSPEVEPGASGRIRLAGVAPVWAEVTAKRPGRSWTWRVGLVELTHTVAPRNGGGSTIGLEMRAPAPMEIAIRVSYAPITKRLLRRLARKAEA